MTIDGKKWGVPYTYYNWGVYYRKDIFENLGIGIPKTWDDFKAAGATLNANGVTNVIEEKQSRNHTENILLTGGLMRQLKKIIKIKTKQKFLVKVILIH